MVEFQYLGYEVDENLHQKIYAEMCTLRMCKVHYKYHDWFEWFFLETCSGIVISGIRAELVGIETPVTSVVDILSVVLVLLKVGF